MGEAARAVGGALGAAAKGVTKTLTGAASAAAKKGRTFTPVQVAKTIANPASAVAVLASKAPNIARPVEQLLAAIPLPQTQAAAAVIREDPRALPAPKLPQLVRSGPIQIDIPEVIRKGGSPMLPALIRAGLPAIQTVGGALLRGAGRVVTSPAAQQVAASYVGTRLAQPGAPMVSQRGIKFGGGGGYFGYAPRRRRRGISASDVRITLRTMKTIKKLYSKLPKVSSRGGNARRRRYY